MPAKKNTLGKLVSGISKAMQDLIHKTFPGGVVEITVTPEESHLADLDLRLRAELKPYKLGAISANRVVDLSILDELGTKRNQRVPK